MFSWIINVWHLTRQYSRVGYLTVWTFFQIISRVNHIFDSHHGVADIGIVHSNNREILYQLIITIFVIKILQRIYVLMPNYVVFQKARTALFVVIIIPCALSCSLFRQIIQISG